MGLPYLQHQWFSIWQRGTSFSDVAGGPAIADRWTVYAPGGSPAASVSRQTFTPGTAPVAGYEGQYYCRVATGSGTTYFQIWQPIENVQTFAGQTVTVSFWAKASSGTPKIGLAYSQNFGSGGSSVVQNPISAVTISTSWARYSVTVAVASISGKTIGTNSSFEIDFWLSAGSTLATLASSIGIQNATISIWGVQLEAGSTATPFQTATGTIQGELAACQRYYWRSVSDTSNAVVGQSNEIGRAHV